MLLLLLPLALGNSQDFGGWRAAGCPGEVIRYAREFLVVDVDLLNDAGINAYVREARVSSESRAGTIYTLTNAPPSTTG